MGRGQKARATGGAGILPVVFGEIERLGKAAKT